MPDKDKLKKERGKSRSAARKALRIAEGFPVPPRKAISQARKSSKKLPYPVAPYPGAGPVQLYRWVQLEWRRLGRWQRLATPVITLVALLTWEREKALQDARWDELERAEARRLAAESYGAFGRAKPKRRKLLGLIPLPSGR